ncbi:MAG: glycine cleavage system protein H [Acidobacteria bacterium CG_4_9_14_3_um_filter_49_7]|nr:MAG: glycine cleavage system protein H [Acidobacteria bacterium CG_4_9_14_3_um_filter_49_7]
MVLEDFYYTKEHEWVQVDGETGTIGITDHAQKQLGDIVFVEVPEVDTELEKGDEAASIESVKAVADVFSPVSGTVTAVNEALEDEPEMVNKEAQGAGWLFRLRLSNKSELNDLMNAAAYAKYLEEEEG